MLKGNIKINKSNKNKQLNKVLKVFDKVKIEKAIIKGDSLSPLLFVLCMEPISRKLNEITVPKMHFSDLNFLLNHLFFIDDLKNFSKNDTLKKDTNLN